MRQGDRARARARVTCTCTIALVGCSAPARPIEAPIRDQHATSAPLSKPLSKLDPSQIDDLPEPDVLAALARAGDAAPAAHLALRAALLAHHRGDDAEARAFVARAASAADESEVHAQLAAVAGELATGRVDPALIAVLLPLSGRYAALGAELRAAIELAPAEGTRWLFLDTQGEPAGASAAVETAAKRGAVAILGPVGAREAIAAARAAALRELPIGLLAPADGADASAGVFRLVESPADEGRAVAQLAAADNFPTVAVLAPRDDVGEEAADAFAAEAARLHLAVTARGSYDPTGGSVEPDVKTFLGLVPAQNPRLAEHLAKNPKRGWQTFSPDIPFSLLYIPDRYDRAAIVAAFLPYFNVELRTSEFPDPARLARKHGGRIPQVVQLVGGAGWHHPTLPKRGGDAVQGALIVDPCPGELGGDVASALVADFQRKTGRAPSSAAAEAHDAAALIAHARATITGSGDPRAAMRAALARGRIDDGACGPAAMDVDGELGRRATVLEVSGDELIVAP